MGQLRRAAVSRVRVIQIGVVVVLAAMVLVAGAVLGSPGAYGRLVFPSTQSTQAEPVDDQTAAAILGRPLPIFLDLQGMSRSGLTADPSSVPRGLPRFVHVSYARGGRNVARLDVWRGSLVLRPGPISKLGSVQAVVTQRELPDGSIDVGYEWIDGDVAFIFHINLVQGLSRQAADLVVASVR
jgi:hypothetical protein